MILHLKTRQTVNKTFLVPIHAAPLERPPVLAPLVLAPPVHPPGPPPNRGVTRALKRVTPLREAPELSPVPGVMLAWPVEQLAWELRWGQGLLYRAAGFHLMDMGRLTSRIMDTVRGLRITTGMATRITTTMARIGTPGTITTLRQVSLLACCLYIIQSLYCLKESAHVWFTKNFRWQSLHPSEGSFQSRPWLSNVLPVI